MLRVSLIVGVFSVLFCQLNYKSSLLTDGLLSDATVGSGPATVESRECSFICDCFRAVKFSFGFFFGKTTNFHKEF